MESTELLKRLREAIRKDEELVPDGWKTAANLSKEWGISLPHTHRMIKRGVDLGVMEQRKFRVSSRGRGVYPLWHYRSKKA